MTFDFLTMKTSSVVERRAERERAKEVEREKAQAVEQAGLHKLELNPYWKDGGSGLPSEDTPVLKATVVDDGGLSWLQKSYQRMREQAQREQRSLEEVVSERYGSMEKFLKRLEEAENATRTKGGHQEERGWKRVGPRSSDIRQDHDLSPVASRGKEQGRDEDRDRDMGGDRNKSGARARDRDRGGHAEEARQRTREEQQPHGETERARPGLSRASLKAKFLKPSDGGHDMSATWGVRRHTPVELLQPSDSEGKPAGGYPAWRKMSCSGQDAIRSTSLEGQSGSGPRAPSPGEVRTEIIMGQQQQKQPHGKVPQSDMLLFVFQAAGQLEEDREVVLYRMDQSGQAWPVGAPSQPLEPRGGRRKKKLVRTHRDGERMRYFADDDSVDLREMVRREKMSSSVDQNALYSRMAAKALGKQDGDAYTLDDMFVSSAAQQERSGQEEERQRSRAVHEHQRLAARMDKCPYCFDSAELPKHLVVAIGTKVYLCLPNAVSLTEGHCLVVPLQHHTAATALDEEVWDEVQRFRRALVKMFVDQEQDCVFLETHMNPKQRRHMVYECVPLPKELGDMAPIYFKKAIMESDEEWAMNKKLVDLYSKDIRRAVPRGLPYFSVDFGLQGGFAHVIENEQKFPHYFGKEVLGGMLDLEPRRWRKPARENFEEQRKKVLQFAQKWKPYDCTKADA
uniref:CWF19-like protein 2 n=1 Tax=Scleropages formosus TaxID=113540 RepID=A0A8C9U7S6_SCLFO